MKRSTGVTVAATFAAGALAVASMSLVLACAKPSLEVAAVADPEYVEDAIRGVATGTRREGDGPIRRSPC